MPEPLELATITQRTAEARQAFAHDVDVFLLGLKTMLDDLDHLDVGSVRATLQAMGQMAVETFDQRLSLNQRPDLQWVPRIVRELQRLVRDAHDLLTNPESRVDRDDWLRAVEPLLRS